MSHAFKGLNIYYSGSMKGSPELDPEFAWKLVRYMKENGANVLSEHVAGRTSKEIEETRARLTGVSERELYEGGEPWFEVRRQDLKWVDEADRVVALVNGPSHGVGMELQRALDKPRLGLPETPILCLVHEEMLLKTSYMIRGIDPEENPNFELLTYTTLEEAKHHIFAFLNCRKKLK